MENRRSDNKITSAANFTVPSNNCIKPKIRTFRQSAKSSDYFGLVGEGGFEPPKRSATDLQSAPFGHSGILPYVKPTSY